MAEVYDKKGIPIHVGDVLKVFHFIGARRKKYYMYKLVKHKTKGGTRDFIDVSHLTTPEGALFRIFAHDQVVDTIEIVQGYAPYNDGRSFESRPRKKVTDGKL